MPCRDYMDDDLRSSQHTDILEERLDKLSRIACKALEHIEASGDGLEILVLRDPEIAEWWRAHKEADRKARERAAEEKRKIDKEAAMTQRRNEIKARLTPAELRILGVK